MTLSPPQTAGSSFRDPAGFVFFRQGIVYRQLNSVYAPNFHHLLSSGLYSRLVDLGLLVAHGTAPLNFSPNGQAFKIIRPDPIPFISYPYEWCFSQLKQAALLTLQIQKIALAHGMILKDASAYNVQFRGSHPVFIDTSSFKLYQPGTPWTAYRQYCRHFLAPLALMTYSDLRLNQLFRPLVDGIPSDLACRILPWSARLNIGLAIHLFWHAKFQGNSLGPINQTAYLSADKLLALVDNLRDTTAGLVPRRQSTPWEKYYTFTNYSPAAFAAKTRLVAAIIRQVRPKLVWDLGANAGVFSDIAARQGAYTIAFDSDVKAVEHHYASLTGPSASRILPLVEDLTNPSPGSGWAGGERQSLTGRGPADLLLALALLHHLCFTHNLPLSFIARYFHQLGRFLLIEFVPKTDSQVVEMFSRRPDIFPDYTQSHFLTEFSQYFRLLDCRPIPGTCRKLYLFKNKYAATKSAS